MKNKKILKFRTGLIFLGLFSILLVQCKQEPDVWKPEQDELQIMEYIKGDSANVYSDFLAMAQKVGMDAILSTRGPFTLFLPDDDAFQAYFESKGKSSYTDFTDEEITHILRNHVVAAEIKTSDIGLGALSEKNALGDYLISDPWNSDTR